MSPPESEPLVDGLHRLFTTLRTQVSAALAPLNVHFSQYVCLRMLSTAPDQSNADLARAAGVTPQAMNGVLWRMQYGGLIDRPDSVSSGRARPASGKVPRSKELRPPRNRAFGARASTRYDRSSTR